jgi:hypothetical protein
MPTASDPSGDVESLPLSKAAEYLLEECRMVLPGIQALFGFQLIAVFSERFARDLSTVEQNLHLLAIGLVALSVALIMSPAAYHRQINPTRITAAFIRISTRLLLASMPPLAIALCIDFYLVAQLMLGDFPALLLTLALFAVFTLLWYVLPRIGEVRRAA